VENVIVAAPSQSLQAAADLAQAQGYDVEMLGDAIEGEARDVARRMPSLPSRPKGRA
jgi:glycerate 2-kinase